MLDHHHLLDELERRVEAARQAFSERRRECATLRARLNELEATRLELLEENRELDEQNSELEAHNRHLHQKLVAGETQGGFPPPTRRAQGLAALIGHRPRHNVATPAAAAPPSSEPVTTAPEAAAPVEHRDLEAPGASARATRDAVAVEEKKEKSEGKEKTERTERAERAEKNTDAKPAVEAEPPSPQGLLEQWYRRYPDAFFKGHTRPLKVGIHQDLAAREPWPEKLVRRALAGYVNLPRYLKAMREEGERIDLAGQPAGVVDAQAADHARQKLERLQASRAAKPHKPQQGGSSGGGAARQGAADDRRSPRDSHQARIGSRDNPEPHRANAGKPGDSPSGVERPDVEKPATERASAPPATLDDKLSALLAKHNRQG